MSRINLNISVPDPDAFAHAIEQAKQTGFKVTQSFEDLGVASGSIEQASIPKLRRIEGLSFEEDRIVSTPMPAK